MSKIQRKHEVPQAPATRTARAFRRSFRVVCVGAASAAPAFPLYIPATRAFMSGKLKKQGPVRQLSLHSGEGAPAPRGRLARQFSEEILGSKNRWIPELGLHVSVRSKAEVGISDRPPPAKPAWAENHAQKNPLEPKDAKAEEGIVAKKCKEIKRPLAPRFARQASLTSKDSILLSHQELAEKLRQAWKEREKSKQNLNIFLAHNVKEKPDAEVSGDLTDSESTLLNTTIEHTPKILSLKSKTVDYNKTNAFQKRMRRAHSVEDSLENLIYSPTTTFDVKTKTVVVVPLVETPKTKSSKEKIQHHTTYKGKDEEKQAQASDQEQLTKKIDKPIDVVIRPNTASSRREGFKSRTNSAFAGSRDHQKPPLVRASSVPLQLSPPKPKFVAVKRKIKSASKKKDSNEKFSTEAEKEQDENKNKHKKFQRCASLPGGEVITMVSLVSPEESEAEDQVNVDKEKPKAKLSSPTKTAPIEKEEKLPHEKGFTLRKAVKSVTFQQSSIHAVRSFSASFPARRGSIATALMLSNSPAKGANGSLQEKRGGLESVRDDDAREPKRRLVRTKSAPDERSLEIKQEDSTNCGDQSKPEPPSENAGSSLQKEEPEKKQSSEGGQDAAPTFDTPKEQQCWDMYCKMSEKGVGISFDTILRGMLTPTEYRLRRKSVATIEEQAEGPSIATADASRLQ